MGHDFLLGRDETGRETGRENVGKSGGNIVGKSARNIVRNTVSNIASEGSQLTYFVFFFFAWLSFSFMQKKTTHARQPFISSS